ASLSSSSWGVSPERDEGLQKQRARAAANAATLRHWAAGLQRRGFRSWREAFLAASGNKAQVISPVKASRWLKLSWQSWVSIAAAASAQIEEAQRAATDAAARVSQRRAVIALKKAAAFAACRRVGGLLVASRGRRRQLCQALQRWQGFAEAQAAWKTLPLRAQRFNHNRLAGVSLRAWLLWLAKRAQKRALVATAKLRILQRTSKLPQALRFWHARTATTRRRHVQLGVLADRSARRLAANLISGWRRYIALRAAKVLRQEAAKGLFAAAARREAMRCLADTFNRRTIQQSSKAHETWPSYLASLLKYLRHWRAVVYASRIGDGHESQVFGRSNCRQVTGVAARQSRQHDSGPKTRVQQVERFLSGLRSLELSEPPEHMGFPE
ncbi:unnamed protein product, partial [Polarella glacialis]